MTDINKKMGSTLKRERESRGLSRAGMQDKSGIDPTTLTSIEHGNMRVTLEHIIKVYAGVGMKVTILAEDDEGKSRKIVFDERKRNIRRKSTESVNT